nr:PREDICTED: transmembrane protease serine 9 [Tribolium castaneum]|eukprot:XP_015839971.1 PREDICTED: transmembrane protease serine 9 [Tribolium castaneum]
MHVFFLFLTSLLVTNAHVQVFKPQIDVRIVGGHATTIEEHPHQVSVIYIDSHYCGGSIIHTRFILTAAHCTYQLTAEDLLVRAGSTMVNSGGQVRGVAQIFQHKNFDIDTYDYDISVLKLSESLVLGSGVAVIPLPEDGSTVPGDLLGTATGWGRLSENGPLPVELQEVDLPTIQDNVCALMYGDRLTERMFCAGYPKGQKDTCQGDSGGPYEYEQMLIGITSWGDGCGAANSPGVYTRVSYFIQYIDDIIKNNIHGDLKMPTIDVRIIGGHAVDIEDYPYQVSIMYIDSHMCGGSLIQPNLILTAAHCIEDKRVSYEINQSKPLYKRRIFNFLPKPAMLPLIILALVITVNGAPHFDGRIVGGRTATIEEYPYQVSLHYYGFHICGGSIISPVYVITAAHCTNGNFDMALTVRAGSSAPNRGGQEITVKKVYQNPLFTVKTMDYDISVLHLFNSIDFSLSALPIGLAPRNYKVSLGTNVTVTGWGLLAEEGESPDQLQVVEIPYITNEKCQKAYEKEEMTISERMLCAQAEFGGKDSCQGDSGGPLVADGLLVGIVSWGFGCARPEYPGVYSRISEFRDFIKNVTQL